MADRINISELDFDTIKNNLKDFLRNQSEFTDYDFEGSGLSILLDILAYNTHYQAYYLNMVANEAFLDTALLRDSVVSHAKTLGYTPASKRASSASINLTVFTDNSDPQNLTVSRGTSFLSNQIDGKTYTFVTLDDVTVSKVGTDFYFENLQIYEGQLNNIEFTYDESNNPKNIFTIPDAGIDKSTITVTVLPSGESTSQSIYELATDLVDITAESEVYFIQEEKSGRFQIYFGNGTVGKKLPDGAVVRVSYLITNGELANAAETFVISQPIDGFTNFDIDTVTAASGGAERETVDSIKYLAPLQYASQNRIVTKSDYELFIKKEYPNVDSVSVWGGEEEIPPIFGKVFISIKPIGGYFISETEKTKIINDIIEPKSVVSIKTEIRDPEFLYVLTNSLVQYNQNKTSLSQEAFKETIRQAIVNYKTLNLDDFSSKLVVSKLDEAINYVDTTAIIGSQTDIRVQKRFEPTLNEFDNYDIRFNIPLVKSTLQNKISSTAFDVNDVNGVRRTVTIEEVPKSDTGINRIDVLDPGYNYTSVPTVTILGNGVGATAIAIVEGGKIQRIDIVSPGTDYTQATVVISGGGGVGASATPIVDVNIGTLRAIYYNTLAEKQIVFPNLGSIDYLSGKIVMNDLKILSSSTSDGLVRINCVPESSIIESFRNTIVTVDEEDPTSISITLQRV
jgi:hypothetical protein